MLRPLLPLLFFAVTLNQAASWELAENSRVQFQAHSWLENPIGTFPELELANYNPKSLTGTLKIHVASIDTGSTGRDEHLIDEDFFHAERYPLATVRVERVYNKNRSASIILTIKEIPKKYEIPITISQQENSVRITGKFSILRSQFEINYNSMFNRIEDKVDLEFDIVLMKN